MNRITHRGNLHTLNTKMVLTELFWGSASIVHRKNKLLYTEPS